MVRNSLSNVVQVMLFLSSKPVSTEAILEEIEQIVREDPINIRANLSLYLGLARDTKLALEDKHRQLQAELQSNQNAIAQIKSEHGGKRTKNEQTLKAMLERAGPRQKRKLESLYGKVAQRLSEQIEKERELTASMYQTLKHLELSITDNLVLLEQLKTREEAARAHMSALEFLSM
jgi:hypothetical protein